MTVAIYALIGPRTRLCRYVGKTKGCIHARLKGHVSDARRNNLVPRFRWITKLGVLGLRPEVIELEAVEDNWQEAERFWIQYMRAIGSPLLNATEGGDGIHGLRHSDETLKKMSISATRIIAADPALRARRGDGVRRAFASPESRAALSARLRESHARPEVQEKLRAAAKASASTPEARARSSRVHSGKTLSPETRKKISQARTGKKLSPETCRRIAAGHVGHRHSEETRQKMRDTWARRRESIDGR